MKLAPRTIIALLCPLFLVPFAAVGDRPNIIFILADDLGYADLSCYGSEIIDTPSVDSLARDGARFTQFYATGAQCTPSRVGFLTGRYPQRVGGMECAIGTGNVGRYDHAINLAEQHDLGLPVEDASLARGLQKAGYHNALIGKWHLGYEPKFHPLDQGFDSFFGFLGGYIDYYYHVEQSPIHVFMEGRQPIEREGYLTDLLTERAVAFIEREHDQPFFLFLSHGAPHSPYQGPDKKPNEPFSGPHVLGASDTYTKMVEALDQGVGRVLEALDRTRLAENTIIVFTSDHGGKKVGSNGPFRGFKGSLFEGGIRIPLVVRWPGHIEPGTVSHQPGTLMDFTASFLDVAAAEPAGGRRLDGIDILGHIQAGLPDYPRTFFWRYRRADETIRAVRSGNRKYLRVENDQTDEEYLFDLAADPAERHSDLLSHPHRAAQLRELLATWEKRVYTDRGVQ